MRQTAPGFTLIELLVTVSIIGLLSTMATVSYSSARIKARDVKRVSDAQQIQSGLELYYEGHGGYPADGRPGTEGAIIGESGATVFSDAGIGDRAGGFFYMKVLPKDPSLGGVTPYVYRSLNVDGSDCNATPCGTFAFLFILEGSQGSLEAGPTALTPLGYAGAGGGTTMSGVLNAGGQLIGLEGVQARLTVIADQAVFAVADAINDPTVKVGAEVAAPALATLAVVNTAAAAGSASSFFGHILFFLSQPLLLFSRKKRKAWGVVYNSLTKLPEDLAIVRLKHADTGRLLKSAVTDEQGRYSFLVQRGRYRIEVVKADLTFPSAVMASQREDAGYADLYHGEVMEVSGGQTSLAPNIPVDSTREVAGDGAVIRQNSLRKLRYSLALLSPSIGAVSVAIRPTPTVVILFLFQILAYFIFRRIAITPEPKSWGIVFDAETKKPVKQAILRLFSLPYYKLLETQVTDAYGRYHFRVGRSIYYLTAIKPGYQKTESDPLDLTAAKEATTVIATDIPLRRGTTDELKP